MSIRRAAADNKENAGVFRRPAQKAALASPLSMCDVSATASATASNGRMTDTPKRTPLRPLLCDNVAPRVCQSIFGAGDAAGHAPTPPGRGCSAAAGGFAAAAWQRRTASAASPARQPRVKPAPASAPPVYGAPLTPIRGVGGGGGLSQPAPTHNPFESGDVCSLSLPTASPSLFECVVSPNARETPGWGIEHLSRLDPVPIDLTPHQNQLMNERYDTSTELQVQRAIDKFFSSGKIVPSPWSCALQRRCFSASTPEGTTGSPVGRHPPASMPSTSSKRLLAAIRPAGASSLTCGGGGGAVGLEATQSPLLAEAQVLHDSSPCVTAANAVAGNVYDKLAVGPPPPVGRQDRCDGATATAMTDDHVTLPDFVETSEARVVLSHASHRGQRRRRCASTVVADAACQTGLSLPPRLTPQACALLERLAAEMTPVVTDDSLAVATQAPSMSTAVNIASASADVTVLSMADESMLSTSTLRRKLLFDAAETSAERHDLVAGDERQHYAGDEPAEHGHHDDQDSSMCDVSDAGSAGSTGGLTPHAPAPNVGHLESSPTSCVGLVAPREHITPGRCRMVTPPISPLDVPPHAKLRHSSTDTSDGDDVNVTGPMDVSQAEPSSALYRPLSLHMTPSPDDASRSRLTDASGASEAASLMRLNVAAVSSSQWLSDAGYRSQLTAGDCVSSLAAPAEASLPRALTMDAGYQSALTASASGGIVDASVNNFGHAARRVAGSMESLSAVLLEDGQQHTLDQSSSLHYSMHNNNNINNNNQQQRGHRCPVPIHWSTPDHNNVRAPR